MKSNTRLPRFLCRLFLLLEVSTLIGGIWGCASLFYESKPGTMSITISSIREMNRVGLVPDSGLLLVQTDDPQPKSIKLTRLQGIVDGSGVTGGAAVAVWNKWFMVALVAANVLFAVVLFDLLRRLFRNVTRSESFTLRNIRLLHWMGTAIIVFTLVSSVTEAWSNHRVTSYLQQHAKIQGAKLTFAPPPLVSDAIFSYESSNYRFQIGWTGILSGLLILALGEVFRQAAVIKEENALTI